MHTPHILVAMGFGLIGVPLAGVFLVVLLVSLAFARTRAFSVRVLVRALGVGLVGSLLMWAASSSALPQPFLNQAALTVFPFWFALGGFFWLFRFNAKSRKVQRDEAA